MGELLQFTLVYGHPPAPTISMTASGRLLSPAWPKVRTIAEIIEESLSKQFDPADICQNKLEELCLIGEKLTLTSLKNLAQRRSYYLDQDRGRTKRLKESKALTEISKSLTKGLFPTDTSALIQRACEEQGIKIVLPNELEKLAKLAAALADELADIADFKFARRWHPYIYGAEIPKIGWKYGKIKPVVLKDALGKAAGPAIEFVRASLYELGEPDFSPDTIAGVMKQCCKPLEPAQSNNASPTFWTANPFAFIHPWKKTLDEDQPYEAAANLRKKKSTPGS